MRWQGSANAETSLGHVINPVIQRYPFSEALSKRGPQYRAIRINEGRHDGTDLPTHIHTA